MNKRINTFPTMAQVESADRYTLCKWWRFLRSGENEQEQKIQTRACDRLKGMGMFTVAISKSLGW